jgi:D-3-phosphoglycerate dehydrogenase
MTRRFKVVRVDTIANIMPELVNLATEAEELATVNAQIMFADCTTEGEIIEATKDADAIITTEAQITRRVLQASPKCRVVVRYGIGFDVIDVDAATDNGIVVVNIPDYCLEEVSNHAITLILACAKKLILLNNTLKQSSWIACKQLQSPMGAIYGQTLGIIGCGNIGQLTSKKGRCFGLRILGYDPYVTESLVEECGITLVSLAELLEKSDFISLHVPLNKETRHLIGGKQFKMMKPTAYFINTARGAIVEEASLIKALKGKWIAGAGLDVFEEEPIDPEHILLKMDNVIITPHSASYSGISYERLKRSVAQEVARVLIRRWPKNVVNKLVKPKISLSK